MKTFNCYNYLDDFKKLVKSLPILENDLKFANQCSKPGKKESERLEWLVV